MGKLNWLAICTRPDLAPIVSFIASYNHSPTKQHLESARYAVRYVRCTLGYGISFSSSSTSRLKSFLHIPLPHDIEAYSDARSPYQHETHELTAFSDANWGPQDASKPKENETRTVKMEELKSVQGFSSISWR